MKKIFILLLIFITANYAQSPCPGTTAVTYAGKTYNTVQIGSQCWLKENLDVGTMIHGSVDQTNNGILEKYCYNNDPSICEKYGGLYTWDEAMKYSAGAGKVQGICPGGWHIPTLDELKILTASVNNQSNPLKEIGQGQGENLGAGTNTSGFSALLAGSRGFNGQSYYYSHLNVYIWLWSTTEYDANYTNVLELDYIDNLIRFYVNGKAAAFSVRCIKGDGSTAVSDKPDQNLLPSEFSISQNFPNPFNPSTAISYQLLAFSCVTLKIYDLLGREVTTLVNEYQQPGKYEVKFDTRHFERSREISSGVYFYRMQAGGSILTKKMILMK
jgi:uncharacterized protein (TIGR02145 family)